MADEGFKRKLTAIFSVDFIEYSRMRDGDDAFAVDLIKEIGPGGQFLGNSHTLAHMRQEICLSDLCSKGTYEDWAKKERLSLEQMAQKLCI
jgi:trimethylamine--corrinoid protein Co-methyltransferase